MPCHVLAFPTWTPHPRRRYHAKATPEAAAVNAPGTLAVASFAPGVIWLITSAYRHGEASAIAPFQYLRLIVVAAFGWVIFGEVRDGWTWLGAAVILIGALIITIAEARRR